MRSCLICSKLDYSTFNTSWCLQPINIHLAAVIHATALLRISFHFSSIIWTLPIFQHPRLLWFDYLLPFLIHSFFWPFQQLQIQNRFFYVLMGRQCQVQKRSVLWYRRLTLSNAIGIWPWITHLTSLNLSCVICEMRMMKMMIRMTCSLWGCPHAASSLCFT